MNACLKRPSSRRLGFLFFAGLAAIIVMATSPQDASTSIRAGDNFGSTMIVSDISLTISGDSQIQVMVEVRSADTAVRRAIVKGKLTVPSSDQSIWIRGRTASNGQFVKKLSQSGPGAYVFEVTEVKARGLTFDRDSSPSLEATLTIDDSGIPAATATNVPSQPPATATATTVVPTATSVVPTATNVPPTTTSGNYCSEAIHNQYVATGPDGNLYPTWHPPVDPATGCVFDHEHGDNPNGNPALQGRNVVFCYMATFTNNCMPHNGYKVFAWSNISHYNAPAHSGASVVMVLHQGTSGAGRFTTVFHDIEIHYYNPNDGREAHIYMLAPFGELLVGCGANDPNMDLRLSQANAPGARQISASKCFDPPNIPYEDWITALYIGTDSQGNWKGYMDPHFAIFNPNTYCIVQDNSCVLGYSDERAGTGADPNSADSWFKGVKREAYLNQVWIRNAGGSTTIWTDPYGKLVPAGQGIPQYLSTVNQQPLTNSAAFGADHDNDPAGAVHAPN